MGRRRSYPGMTGLRYRDGGQESWSRNKRGPDENTLRERLLGETKTRKDGRRHEDCNRDCGNRELWNNA